MDKKIKQIKQETLFLWLDPNVYFIPSLIERHYNIGKVYRDKSLFQVYLRKVQNFFKLSSFRFLLDDWIKQIDDYSTIIIPASTVTVSVVKYLSAKYSNKRIIIWYWNPVSKTIFPHEFNNMHCEIWSFDYLDCIRYNLKHNIQYYNMELRNNYNISACKYDFLFIGSDKGRLKQLIKLENFLKKCGYKTYFHITANGKSDLGNEHDFNYRKNITYEECLELVKQSRCLVDVVSEGQTGLSLRPLEAMCFDKKLLTNNPYIFKQFNDKNNIFLIDLYKEIDDNKLKKFLSLDIKYHHKYSYDIDSWLLNFFK